VEYTRLAEAVCGPNYTYGHGRAGTVVTLQGEGRDHGFAVHVVPPMEIDGITVSSTAIRTFLRTGDVGRAGRLLGRWYGIRGTVVRGNGRGEELGFPTANLRPPADKVTPAQGIYAGFARVPSGAGSTPGSQAAISVGTRPTFGPGELLIEAHLIDVSVDLYGAEIDLQFVERLRDELKFASIEELIRQMHADVEQARVILVTPEIR
ncbi:MAG TPA: riboflavin kinase, partial [bacterium]|nr:riboflavin kinase [bacterium]